MNRLIYRVISSALVALFSCNDVDEVEPAINKKPECQAVVNPSSGTAPLAASFSGTASDTDGSITTYEWDFDGDNVYDFSSPGTLTTNFTYMNPGNYTATLRVTDDKGMTSTSSQVVSVTKLTYKFDGFQDMAFAVGDYWKYEWTYDGTTNGSQEPREAGYVTIRLIDQIAVKFTVIGELTLYQTEYSSSGDDYPLAWYSRPYLAVKNGIIYIAQVQDGQWVAAELLNAQTGKFFGDQGFVGYFSKNRTETVTSSFITDEFNSAYSSTGVIVSEPFYKPECETIAGVSVCDDVYHDYQVKEYYLPGMGFAGFYRSGTSIFSGGGYVDIFKSTMKVWLVDTNVK